MKGIYNEYNIYVSYGFIFYGYMFYNLILEIVIYLCIYLYIKLNNYEIIRSKI